MRCILLFVTIFFSTISYSQVDDATYYEVERVGKIFTQPIREGHIEGMKNNNPPKDMWTYEKLIEYKTFMKGSENILRGSYIMPSTDKDIYIYNEFAYTKEDNGIFRYFYVGAVAVNISGEKAVVDQAYLFTETKSLRDWWLKTFGYYQSDESKKIPQEFMYPICPPPPPKKAN